MVLRMKNSYSNKIYGDGKNLVLIMEEGKNQIAYTFDSPLLTNFIIENNRNIENLQSFGGKIICCPNETDVKFNIEFHTLPNNFKIVKTDKKDLSKTLDVLPNISIKDMFLLINKKLSKRQKYGD